MDGGVPPSRPTPPARSRGQHTAQPNLPAKLDRGEHRHTIQGGGTPPQPQDQQPVYTDNLTSSAICREYGIEHLLTLPRSPTTTGKIERFHRTLRAEFDTRQIFTSLQVAQQALDEWVAYYNTARPHQALRDATPAERFSLARDTADSRSGSATPVAPTRAVINSARATDRDGDGWISRRVGPNGVVCVSWQQVSIGKHRAGQRCDVLVNDQLLQFWIGAELVKTVTRTSTGEVRKKHAQGARPGPNL